MKEETKQYCVVATDRQTKKRVMLTDGMSNEAVLQRLSHCNLTMKRHYTYFKVAKYPFKAPKR